LVWDGVNVTSGAPLFLSHRPRMVINSPVPIAGTYSAVGAAFGATVSVPGVTAGVTLVTDGVAPPNDACQAITNAGAIAGKIALIDRGLCNFEGCRGAGGRRGGGDHHEQRAGLPPTIRPALIRRHDSGDRDLPGGQQRSRRISRPRGVTVGGHPTLLSGADATGKRSLFAPSTFSAGSSVSHWDVSLTPNALMEPFINPDLHDQVDLARDLFKDLGWNPATPVALALFTAEGRMDGIFLRWFFSDGHRRGHARAGRASRGAMEPDRDRARDGSRVHDRARRIGGIGASLLVSTHGHGPRGPQRAVRHHLGSSSRIRALSLRRDAESDVERFVGDVPDRRAGVRALVGHRCQWPQNPYVAGRHASARRVHTHVGWTHRS
jgi:hypothetical protein